MRISMVSKLYAVAGVALCVMIAIGIGWQHSQLPNILSSLSEGTQVVLSTTLFRVGGQPVRVFFLIKCFLFLVFLQLLAKGVQRLLGFLVRRNPRMDTQRKSVLSKSITIAIYAVGIMIGIQVEQINFTALAIVGGTLGLGIGFGLQTVFSNLVSGLTLLIEQPIRLCDRIEFGDKSGEVVRIGSRSSSIRTSDNAIYIIPNSDFITKPILNWTVSDPKILRTLAVSVACGTDPDEVIRILLELANNHPDVMKDPAPGATLSELGMHAMTFSLGVWTLIPPERFSRLKSDLYLSILRRFKEKNIEMPFPQLDLHIKSIEAPVSITNV